MTLAHIITGAISPAAHSVQRNTSIHAGSTGLTGLTGVGRAHECINGYTCFASCEFCKIFTCVISTMLTLLTLIKASIHAGLPLTGFALRSDNPCKALTRAVSELLAGMSAKQEPFKEVIQ
ncbi:MAG: hypothetical protein ACOH2S_12050 [Janthinobacterium svalbardensis]